MLLRSMMFGLGLAMTAAGAADASCVMEARGSRDAEDFAQHLAKYSESSTVRGAYDDGSCRIEQLLHPGGDPCQRYGTTYHVTLRANHTTYHVFDEVVNYGQYYCTTR